MPGFKDALDKTDKVFGEDMTTAGWKAQKKAVVEEIRTSVQNIQPKRLACIALASTVLSGGIFGAYGINEHRLNTINIEASYSLSTANSRMIAVRKAVEDAKRYANDPRRVAYVNAIEQLQAERAEQEAIAWKRRAAEEAVKKKELEAKLAMTDLDTGYYKVKTCVDNSANCGETVMEVDMSQLRVSQVRHMLGKEQQAELDGILATVLNGEKRAGLLNDAAAMTFQEFIESRCLGEKDEKGRLRHFVASGQSDALQRLRKLLRTIDGNLLTGYQKDFEKAHGKAKFIHPSVYKMENGEVKPKEPGPATKSLGERPVSAAGPVKAMKASKGAKAKKFVKPEFYEVNGEKLGREDALRKIKEIPNEADVDKLTGNMLLGGIFGALGGVLLGAFGRSIANHGEGRDCAVGGGVIAGAITSIGAFVVTGSFVSFFLLLPGMLGGLIVGLVDE